MHLSRVIGLLIAGIVLTTGLVGIFTIEGNEAIISQLAHLGLYSLMFISGLEISGNILFKEEKHALLVTFSTMLSSFVFGVAVVIMLGFSLKSAIVMGICFGVTAEATKARVLIQLKKMNTKLGALLMGTGITNDLLGILAFLVLIYFFTDNVSLSEVKILSLSVVSFFLGMFAHHLFGRFEKSVKYVERGLLFFFVPFFFVEMGVYFNGGLSKINFLVLLAVIITSIVGQMLGVFLVGSIIKLRPRQQYLLGWGMNSKGAVELAIASIALNIGLINYVLYSSLVVTVLVSTFLFQIIIMRTVKANPDIMN